MLNGKRFASTDMEKFVLSVLFASVFSDSQAAHASHVPDLLRRAQGNKTPHTVRKEQVQDCLMRPKYVPAYGARPHAL